MLRGDRGAAAHAQVGQPLEGVVGRAGVQGAGRAALPGLHHLDQRPCLLAADLAQPHAADVHHQRLLDQLGQRHLAEAAAVRAALAGALAGLERHHPRVPVGQLVQQQLEMLLDRGQVLLDRQLVGQRPQQQGLAGSPGRR